MDLETLSPQQLLTLYSKILTELTRREIVRSANNPTADIAEGLVANALGLTLVDRSNPGFDAISPDGVRYEVKSRRITRGKLPPHFGDIRDIEAHRFDTLACVVLNEDFSVHRAALLPYDTVKTLARYQKYTNGWRVRIADSVLGHEHATDITTTLRRTQEASSILLD